MEGEKWKRESEVVEVMKWDGMGWDGMDWRRRRAEEPRQLQVRHLMRVHTSLNNYLEPPRRYSLWTFATRPSI